MRFNMIDAAFHFEKHRFASILPKASPNTIVTPDQHNVVFEYSARRRCKLCGETGGYVVRSSLKRYQNLFKALVRLHLSECEYNGSPGPIASSRADLFEGRKDATGWRRGRRCYAFVPNEVSWTTYILEAQLALCLGRVR
jgi:hypothetical protein